MNSTQRKGPKKPMETAKRLLKYVTGTYKAEFIFVFVCILVCSVATISVSLSMKFLLPLSGAGGAGVHLCAGNFGILLL